MEGGAAAAWIVAIAGLIGLLSCLIYAFFQSLEHSNNRRGPVVYPLVGNLFQLLKNKHRIFDWATEMMQRDGSQTMRIVRPGGRQSFSTANPENIEHMLRKHFENYPKGKHFQSIMTDFIGHGIFNVDGDLWRVQRKVASYEFTTRSLRDFMLDSVKMEIQTQLIPTLTHFCESEASVDLQDLLLRFSFDNICKLAFGFDPACLHFSLPAVKLAEAFDIATSTVAGRFFCPHPLFWKVKRALNIGSERRLRKALQVVHQFAMDIIRKRRKELLESKGGNELHREHQDLLSRFMKFTTSEMEADLVKGSDPDEFLRDIVISFVLAGRDTTAAALSWFFWSLCTHPHVQERCHNEIQGILEAGLTSQDLSSQEKEEMQPEGILEAGLTSQDLSSQDKEDMQPQGILEAGLTSQDLSSQNKEHRQPQGMLEAGLISQDQSSQDKQDKQPQGILETGFTSQVQSSQEKEDKQPQATIFSYNELKQMDYLHAAISESLRLYPPVAANSKISSEDDVWPDGTIIPKNTPVSYYPYATARMESFWGKDCKEFQPERWLTADGLFVPENPYKFPVFQAGLIGPTKSIPHFSNGARGRIGDNGQFITFVGLPDL
ncbi:hypothetical protein O6H91_03G007400 [Diphasiastrum complanatum]|uniref:Uncharacterized protein n=1 Tax=Diphasiastrum complanatum TaxID=34168 RepID=A0ACC2E3B7_DIPCM|nr:hypothetical protein O6H91_03G007400 [Diphasiastrum complanatum]